MSSAEHISLEDYNALKAENARLKEALEYIALLGGNLSDERLTERTGPNDARQRGIMYISARLIAKEAINE